MLLAGFVLTMTMLGEDRVTVALLFEAREKVPEGS